VNGEADTVTWLGHSSVVIEVDGIRLLTDPVLRRRLAHLRRLPDPPEPEAVGRLDGILISHVHLDHLDTPSLRRLPHSLRIVVPRGADRIVRRCGFRHIVEAEPGDDVVFGPVHVQVTPAEHGVVRRFLRARTPALGFVVRGSHDVYFAGDTDLFDGMADLRPVDVALLPVAGWGTRLPPGHLDAAGAVGALELLRPRVAIPVHWGTLHPAFASHLANGSAPETFAAIAAERTPDVDVRVLAPGETLLL